MSNASEFDTMPVRPGEEELVRRLVSHAPVAVDKPRFSDPHVKVNALLQAHFSRAALPGDLSLDQRACVLESLRLLQVGGWVCEGKDVQQQAQRQMAPRPLPRSCMGSSNSTTTKNNNNNEL